MMTKKKEKEINTPEKSKKEKKKFLDEKFEKRLLPKKEKKGIAKLFG